MDFYIVDYRSDLDKELLELFQKSVFYKRKEFEYMRDPNEWIYRYKLSDDYIARIALHDNTVVASLGVVTRKAMINDRKEKTGCFVDNCILPDYLDHYEDVFGELFASVEEEARKHNISVIYGWEFLKHLKNHQKFFEDLGFVWVEGVDWFPGGSDIDEIYPKRVNYNLSLFWRTAIKLSKFWYRLEGYLMPKLPKGVLLRSMEDNDINKVCKLMNSYIDVEFRPCYEVDEYHDIVKKNNIHGIVAEKNNDIIAVLTYIISAWSGWMYGKPYYTDKWGIFYSYTPDDFIVLPEYQNTSVPAQMIEELMKTKDPKRNIKNIGDYSLMVDVFDRRIRWRHNALLKAGCTEPRFDYGVILAKSLREDIELDTTKPWYLPSRYIIAPVPRR